MISIASRLRPFSHTPGAKCLLPGTDLMIKAEPHRLEIGDIEIALDNDPFSFDFTLQQDLERDCVWVFGKKYRIKIWASPDGFFFHLIGKEKQFFPAKIRYYSACEMERLSLGSNKSQDWDLVLRRMDLKEILPFLFFLGQKVGPSCSGSLCGSIEELYPKFFHHMLVPRKEEENILTLSFSQIRSLFFIEQEGRVQLLPFNPFPEGRMVNIQTAAGSLDIEWTKRRLRRAVFHPKKTGEIRFDLPKEITQFRKKRHLHEKGLMHNVKDPLFFEQGTTLFLDCFWT